MSAVSEIAAGAAFITLAMRLASDTFDAARNEVDGFADAVTQKMDAVADKLSSFAIIKRPA